MNTTTNEEIEKTLNSLDGLERVEISPLVADRIFRKAMESSGSNAHTETARGTNLAWVLGVAAVFIINFSVLFWVNNNNHQSSEPETLTELYFDSEINY